VTGVPAPRRPRRRGVRARIAIACAGLFLVLGGVLVATTYSLASHTRAQANGSGGILQAPAARCPAGPAGITKPPPVSAPSGQQASICQNTRRDFQAGATDQAGADRHDFLVYSLAGLGAATLLAAGLGWGVSGRVLRPLRAITMAARAASQENLDQRLTLTGPPDELKELADTFDGMLARLDGAFASQRRFVANASHELRTPLTEMRTLIDVTLAKPARPAAQLCETLAGVRAAVDRSEELIEALLTLARSDSGLRQTEVVDLPTAVEDAIDQASITAAAKQVQIDTSLQPAQVTGDRVLIERLASNLIDNAVRHNVPGGWVRAATCCKAGTAELTITSSGDPIPPDQVAGLFEPFRRLSGRAGNQSGAGLGLSIVASVARTHGGRAEAHSRSTGGLEVRIKLPATALPYPSGHPGIAG
jgi:signal transduction histidine kinase